MCENLSLEGVFYNGEVDGIHNGPKWTISASGGLELLQMVSELETEWCASEDAWPLRRVNCEIPLRLEKGM